MKNQLKNIFNSPVCEISFFIIVCSMVVTNTSIKANEVWTDIAVASVLGGGIVLFGLLIWATYKLIARKEVKEMSPKPRLILESCSRLLLVYWIYITIGQLFALIWAVLIIWDGVRSIRAVYGNE